MQNRSPTDDKGRSPAIEHPPSFFQVQRKNEKRYHHASKRYHHGSQHNNQDSWLQINSKYGLEIKSLSFQLQGAKRYAAFGFGNFQSRAGSGALLPRENYQAIQHCTGCLFHIRPLGVFVWVTVIESSRTVRDAAMIFVHTTGLLGC